MLRHRCARRVDNARGIEPCVARLFHREVGAIEQGFDRRFHALAELAQALVDGARGTPGVARTVATTSRRWWWCNSGMLLNSVLTIAWFDRLGLPRLS